MRIEKDSLGALPIPTDAYYGIHTLRAKQNFAITGQTVDLRLIHAIAQIKLAAAIANGKDGTLTNDKVQSIRQAVTEIQAGKLDTAFIIDPIQGGAGTSTNMNVNEVITNRALELMGHQKGAYTFLHPLDDVNKSQSTNDVYPSGGKLALLNYLEELSPTIDLLIATLEAKAIAFADIPKIGRTQLQEAIPTTMGASFAAFASGLQRCKVRLQKSATELYVLNMGGTAIGNCLNASATYQKSFYQALNHLTKRSFQPSPNLIDATQNLDTFVALSGSLKALAVTLSKIAHDFRLLSSGPQSGFNELNLPQKQAGSSIMPGKVNPVIPEVVSQVAFQVIGYDTAITFAAESGELELNAFEPLIFHNLFATCQVLQNACTTFAAHCVKDVTVNSDKCHQDVAKSTGTITRLAPILGYETASRIVKLALTQGLTVNEVMQNEGLHFANSTLQKLG